MQECRCGSLNCRGTIGKKVNLLKRAIIPLEEEDISLHPKRKRKKLSTIVAFATTVKRVETVVRNNVMPRLGHKLDPRTSLQEISNL